MKSIIKQKICWPMRSSAHHNPLPLFLESQRGSKFFKLQGYLFFCRSNHSVKLLPTFFKSLDTITKLLSVLNFFYKTNSRTKKPVFAHTRKFFNGHIRVTVFLYSSSPAVIRLKIEQWKARPQRRRTNCLTVLCYSLCCCCCYFLHLLLRWIDAVKFFAQRSYDRRILAYANVEVSTTV